MKKTALYAAAVGAFVLALLGGCNNFFHELVPPDENRIQSFSVPGQIGAAQIGESTVRLTVGPGADITDLLPAISVPAKATLLPVTIPYIQKAFPSANVFREGMGFYTSADRAAYVIDLIKRNPDFTVPALDEAMDFSGPVSFLVISGLGNIRQYTVTVEIDTAEGKFLSFGFTKFDNPDLTKGDAAGFVDNDSDPKTIKVEVWYPVENIASFKLIPSFETNGAVVSLEGVELTSGTSVIDFGKPALAGWDGLTRTETLTVTRPGFEPADYTLTVTFREDQETIRSITDFRFEAALNYGVEYTAMGEITESGDTGTITLLVHYTGPLPISLKPSFVSPGTVSVEGAAQISGDSAHNFTQDDVYYDVVSKDGNYTRMYRVTVEFVNEEDSRPRIETFVFTVADNSGLTAGTSAMIDHGAGLIIIEAVYDTDPAPSTLIPRFSAGGPVSVGGIVQQSGAPSSSQDFSHKVKYTVKDPGNPGLYRDYWVEARFVKSSQSLAEISDFRFFTVNNPGLSANVPAVIDQETGTIYAVLPFTGPPSASNGGHRTLYPQWTAQGTVQVGGAVQTSGVSGAVFAASHLVYRAVSADGAFYRDYTVKVLEVNTRIYVDADAAGDNTGVSWANAFTSLADACKAAEKLPPALSAEVWIAQGSYRPSETRDKAAYFKVRPATEYYGGFAGTETAKTERVPLAHPVTITGDLGGGVYAEHLFMNADLGSGNAAFGEMKFTKAKALTGGTVNQSGPAINVNYANSLSITACTFEDMEAGSYGGAVYAFSNIGGGSLSIADCTFTDTRSGNNGGAVDVSFLYTSNGSISITDCTFTDTRTTGTSGFGGAVGASGGSVTITDCRFENTLTTLSGGAVEVSTVASGGSVSITGCTFTGTQSGNAGGAVQASANISGGGGSISITGCIFETIRAGSVGGAVDVSANGGGSVNITDCHFTDTRGNAGGAVYASSSNSAGSVSITGCTFTDTQATGTSGTGGAVEAYFPNGSVTITGCSFTDTQATFYGGAVCVYSKTIAINGYTSNNTTANNKGGSLYISIPNTVTSTVSVSNSSITNATALTTGGGSQGGGGIYIATNGDMDASPLFTAEFSNVSFTDVRAQGSAAVTVGGAVHFSVVNLIMTNCSIVNASSTSTYAGTTQTGGGAIGGAGTSSCVLNGVSFSGCTAPRGSILYGYAYYIGGAPAYTVGPGCKVEGTVITSANWSSVLSGSMVDLTGGSTISVP